MTGFLAFIMSAFSSMWNCVKGLFSGQGTSNETGMTTTTETGVLGTGLSGGELAGLGLGAAMLINPNGTGHLIGKVGSAAANAVGDTASAVADNVSDVANDLLKQPWFWVAGGIFLIWLLKD